MMKRRSLLKGWSVATLLAFTGSLSLLHAQSKKDALFQGFQNPPASARPRVWWHWMNGNITKEGIKSDLEWMKRVGIAGFQNFDAALLVPKLVDKRLVYMTPEWKEAFRFATDLADQLGLEMAIAGSPGWSESGGPWVQPYQAMKKLVWSETYAEGGRAFTGRLPLPPTTAGPFQNLPLVEFSFGPPPKPPQFYRDTAVIAFRVGENEAPDSPSRPKITTSGGEINPALLSDGDLVKSVALPKSPNNQKSWIQFEYPTPQAIYALTSVTGGAASPFAQFMPVGPSGQELQASDDGVTFQTIAILPGGAGAQHTIAIPKTLARFFRVTFSAIPPPANPFAGLGGDDPLANLRLPSPPSYYEIAELVLHTSGRVHHFEDKAAFTAEEDLYRFPTPSSSSENAIRMEEVLDITSQMRQDGMLNWIPPAGHWKILRLGYALTGKKNAPASAEATGLEVDKLNPNHVKSYFDTYLGMYKETVGSLMGKRGLQYVITDSWEAGVQNWTEEMIPEFTRRRGYDPRPWLPVLTGRVVQSHEASDHFLWDFRKTLADLVAEYHYDQLTKMLHDRGMGRYSESHESGRAFIGDGMEVKRTADIPMSAMWTPRQGMTGEQYGYNADIHESASVAHIYGQNLVAAESLTANAGAWAWSPERLKPTADKEMAMGLNRFVIHTSVHQPFTDRAPGIGLGPFGQWFTRNETWAELAPAWINYLSRCSYLLQQGHYVADILYFYGEDNNVTALYKDKAPPIPNGYDFDYVNADAILHRLSVKGDKIVTPSGMEYRVLALAPNSRQMSLAVLRKISDLVKAGAVVIGEKPTNSPSLGDNKEEFQTLITQLWGDGKHVQKVGKGRIYSGEAIGVVLQLLNVVPDVDTSSKLDFVHRRLPNADLYFVNNPSEKPLDTRVNFRVAGREPELWYPDTAKREEVSYSMDSRTEVSLRLHPHETVFVMFRKPTAVQRRTLAEITETALTSIGGVWEVRFQAGRGAPESITLDKLQPWNENPDPGIKYFSGTGTYFRTLTAPTDWFQKGRRLWLDLGDVKNLAEVSVNGKKLGILWKAPFRVEITGALKPGENQITIAVTNLWVNRLIGDQQPNTTKKYTFTAQAFYRAKSPLLPSGLIGDVQIIQFR